MMVNCASNLRQLAMGFRMYAEANNGFLVEHYGHPKTFTNPGDTTTMRNSGSGNAVDNPDKETTYHGLRLWKTGIIKTGRVMFCPANYEDKDFGWYRVEPNFPYDTSIKYRSDYVYNPHWNQRPDPPGPSRIPAFPKLAKFPRTRVLVGDIFRSQAYTSHKNRGKNPAWNLAFADGHVVTVRSQVVWDQMGIQGDFENQSNKWGVLENYRDMLETLAEGGDIFAHPDGTGSKTVFRVKHQLNETDGGQSR